MPQFTHVRLVPGSTWPLVPGGHLLQSIPHALYSPAAQNFMMPVHIVESVCPVVAVGWKRPVGQTPSHLLLSTLPVDPSRWNVSTAHAPVHFEASTFPIEASPCHLPATHAPSQRRAMLLAALDQRPCSHCVHSPGLSSAVTRWPMAQEKMVGAVVGMLVGDVVGTLVVGADVGVEVGAVDGAVVGTLVVGAVVGAVVVGAVDGAVDGAVVGALVGWYVTGSQPVHVSQLVSYSSKQK